MHHTATKCSSHSIAHSLVPLLNKCFFFFLSHKWCNRQTQAQQIFHDYEDKCLSCSHKTWLDQIVSVGLWNWTKRVFKEAPFIGFNGWSITKSVYLLYDYNVWADGTEGKAEVIRCYWNPEGNLCLLILQSRVQTIALRVANTILQTASNKTQ